MVLFILKLGEKESYCQNSRAQVKIFGRQCFLYLDVNSHIHVLLISLKTGQSSHSDISSALVFRPQRPSKNLSFKTSHLIP